MIVSPRIGFGQLPPARAISSAQLLADAEVLRQVYESAHPGLYRYNSKTRMEEHFAALRKEFGRDRTLADAYLAISRFLARIQCGHTYANFFNQPKAVVQALFTGKNRVPFLFRWIDGKMIVTRDLSGKDAGDPQLQPGAEILAINGHKASDILAALMTIARADGSNDAKRTAYLEVIGTGKYEAFDIYLPLFFPSTDDRITLLMRKPSANDIKTLTVAAHDHEQRKLLAKESGEPQSDESDPLWRFERLDDRTAYIRMSSWALYNSKWDWRTFLNRGLDELIDKRVPGLIVDLRGNEGGQDVGDALLARLTATPIRSGQSRRYTRYQKLALPAAIDACLDTWDPSFRNWGDSAKADRGGFFQLTRFDDDDKGNVIVPMGKRYEGKVAVLIDAANSSATFQFAQTVKQHRLATLVGQTTGGNQRGINGGAFFFVRLPNSKIEVDLPLIATFIGDERPDGDKIPFQNIPDVGIDPDVRITPRVEDIARGVDAELEAAKNRLTDAISDASCR